MFVTIEGVEGSGKTTVARDLVHRLEQDYPGRIVHVREPGGTPVGERLRSILLDHDMPPIAKACVVSAARACVMHDVVLPALRDNKIVICDRHVDTTLVMQGYGEGVELANLRSLIAWTTYGALPDLTLYLDIDPVAGFERKTQQGEINYLDQLSLTLGSKYREGYQELILIDPARWRIIDASASMHEVTTLAYWMVIGSSMFRTWETNEEAENRRST